MSSVLQHKMYDYEVTPPAKVWEHVAAALDESELSHTFPATLYSAEVLPPATAWEKIAASLDPSETFLSLPSKLYAYEVAPPATAWEKINNILDSTTGEEEIINERRRIFPLLRYAAAAAIIGIIIFGAMQFFRKDNTGKNIVKNGVIAPGNTNQNLVDNAGSIIGDTNNTSATDETSDNAALEESKGTVAKLDLPAGSKMKRLPGNYFSNPVDLAGNTTELNPDETYREMDYATNIQSALNNNETKANLADRYIMLMTPDGNVIRMSKKLGDLVCCVSGAEQDADCKDQLKKWREKIAASSKASSPGNVMDMLDLVKSLQESSL